MIILIYLSCSGLVPKPWCAVQQNTIIRARTQLLHKYAHDTLQRAVCVQSRKVTYTGFGRNMNKLQFLS